MFNNSFIILNPPTVNNTGGGGSTTNFNYLTNAVVRFPQFLRTLDGAYSNSNPYVIATNGTISSVVIFTQIAEQDQFDVEIYRNGTAIQTFTKPNGVTSVTVPASIAVVAGDRLSVKIINLAADIDVPGCTLIIS